MNKLDEPYNVIVLSHDVTANMFDCVGQNLKHEIPSDGPFLCLTIISMFGFGGE